MGDRDDEPTELDLDRAVGGELHAAPLEHPRRSARGDAMDSWIGDLARRERRAEDLRRVVPSPILPLVVVSLASAVVGTRDGRDQRSGCDDGESDQH